MRIALLSDIHANAAALDAVLADAQVRDVSAIWNLGDTVGYGPDPDEVVDVLRSRGERAVRGNHDAAAIGEIPLDNFNTLAAAAARWTAGAISTETASYLHELEPVHVADSVTLCHGTLRDPTWEYLDNFDAAAAHFELQETWISVVGHTHRQALVCLRDEGEVVSLQPALGEAHPLAERVRWCINPGGVGQPRDGDPRACYAVLDLGAAAVTYLRVPYDIPAVQGRMRARGLPEPLVARLARGR